MLNPPALWPVVRGLVDGSSPLPLPHPQRLSFPNDERLISELTYKTCLLVIMSGQVLDEADLKHLLFKTAAWCSRRGAVRVESIEEEIDQIAHAVSWTLCVRPEWVKSRGGVGWAVRRYKQYRCEIDALARRSYVAPPRVMELNQPGFYLVELTNGAHVHREGAAMGHCMASSVNRAVLMKVGHDGRGSLEALTYAVKLRSRELRIFSVRDLADEPVLTIAYACKEERIQYVVGRYDRVPVEGLERDAILAVSKVVPVDDETGWRADCGLRPRRRELVFRPSQILRLMLEGWRRRGLNPPG